MVVSGQTRLRVTRVVCPCCKGTNDGLFGWCTWCKGEPRVPVSTALHYADVTYMLAGGGYIAGDLDLSDKRRMEAEAQTIYDFIGEVPRWKLQSHSS